MSRFDGVGVPLSIGWVLQAATRRIATLSDRLLQAGRSRCVTRRSGPARRKAAPAARAGKPDVVGSFLQRAISSGGERFVHTEEVTGSIPVSPTQVRGPVRDLRTGPSSPVQQRSTATSGRGTRSCTPPPAYRLVQPVAVDARYRKADGSALGVAFRAGRGQERALARRRGAGPPAGLAGCFTGGRSSASFSTRGPGRAYPSPRRLARVGGPPWSCWSAGRPQRGRGRGPTPGVENP
jgi:hypothetical protein